MERLAEQIVDWHNRHPLARRIAVGDIHTIGVVALPFVRASAQAGGVVEPVLTDAVSAFDELHGSPPVSRGSVWLQRLKALPSRLPPLPGFKPRTQWRAFSEKFLPGLSPAQVERFALAHGFDEAPATPETRPWRVIVIDEALASSHGGWPFELYLMTAGIDVGSARTRVLAGRGIPSEIAGRRLWDPIRLGAAGAVVAVLVVAAAWTLWPRHAADPAAAPPVPAASAAVAASTPDLPMVASAPARPTLPASMPESAVAAASAAEPAGSEGAGEQPPPDIRPHLVERTDGIKRPPLRRSEKPADADASAPSGKAVGTGATGASAAATSSASSAASAVATAAEPVDPRLARMAQAPDKQVVALVGPPGSKAEAEALLAKMKAGMVGVHSNPDSLQADVIQTPDGWRATVWPFASREQAQLINAILVARGLKTKAVNF